MNQLVNLPPSPAQWSLGTHAQRVTLAEQILKDIHLALSQKTPPQFDTRLGPSDMGAPCERQLWYKFRWHYQETFNALQLKTFEHGHLEESRVFKWLKDIGCKVEDRPDKPERKSIIGGHFGATRDNAIILERYHLTEKILLEIKTKGTGKMFRDLKDQGVYETNERHWAQLCIYGQLWEIRYACYICNNKNDDDTHIELVELDWAYAEKLMEKAQRIIIAPTPPKGISTKPEWWQCKICPAQPVCQLGVKPMVNCRSCHSAQAVDAGAWYCHTHLLQIPSENIAHGCDKWMACQ